MGMSPESPCGVLMSGPSLGLYGGGDSEGREDGREGGAVEGKGGAEATKEEGSEGAEEEGSEGAEEEGSKGAEEAGSKGAEEEGSEGAAVGGIGGVGSSSSFVLKSNARSTFGTASLERTDKLLRGPRSLSSRFRLALQRLASLSALRFQARSIARPRAASHSSFSVTEPQTRCKVENSTKSESGADRSREITSSG